MASDMRRSEKYFLVGAERSGTTMLRLMLNSHPEIAWQNEFEFAVDKVSDNGDFPKMADFYEWLSLHRIFNSSDLKIDRDLDYPCLIEDFLNQRSVNDSAVITGATVHRHFDRLSIIFPEAKYIHFIRDGRDVALSNIGMGWAGNVFTGVQRWVDAEQLWDRVCSNLTKDQYIEIRYEELVSSPFEVLNKLCEFLGVAYHDGMLLYHKETNYSLPDASHVQSWKRKLSDSDVSLIEGRAHKMLISRNYELSGQLVKEISRLHWIALIVQDKYRRAIFRINRFGFNLVLQDFISKKLGLKAWQNKIRVRLNSVTQAKLK